MTRAIIFAAALLASFSSLPAASGFFLDQENRGFTPSLDCHRAQHQKEKRCQVYFGQQELKKKLLYGTEPFDACEFLKENYAKAMIELKKLKTFNDDVAEEV